MKIPVLMHLLILMFLLAMPAPGNCQQPTLKDPLLDSMTGRWVLSGEIMGKQTTHDVDAAWVLNHQFLRIHETSREKTEQGLPQYEAVVYLGWDARKDEYAVHWIDVYGGGFSSVGYAPKEENSIPILFQSPDGNFHTTFTYYPKAKAWEWEMDNEQGGKLKPFARLNMKKRAEKN